MVNIWDHFKERLDVKRLCGKDLTEVGLERHFKRWEVILADELFASPDVRPVIVGLLNSKELTRVDPLEGLSCWELKGVLKLGVEGLVGVPGECDAVLGRLGRLNHVGGHVYHV